MKLRRCFKVIEELALRHIGTIQLSLLTEISQLTPLNQLTQVLQEHITKQSV